MALTVQGGVWDGVVELTKCAQSKGGDPLGWAVQLITSLNSTGVTLPSPELAHLLVSHIFWGNNVPIAWKFLEKAVTGKMVPLILVLALLSVRVIPRRRLQPASYRLYMELIKRHAFPFSSQINCPNCQKIMKSVDDVLHLSQIFGLQPCEPGVLVVEFVFCIVWQLLDATLDDEGLLDLTPEKKSRWLIRPEDIEIDDDNYNEKLTENHERLQKANSVMAVELIGQFLENKLTSRLLYLARRNMPSQWGDFIQHLRLLGANSTALNSSKFISPEALLQLSSDTRKVLFQERKTNLQQEFHAVMSSGPHSSSVGQCHGAGHSSIWLPLDLFLEDANDGSEIAATGAIEILSGFIRFLQAVNGTTWHDAFLGLWFSAIRHVQREREPIEGPVPGLETCLCMLFSITTLAVADIIEEEEVALMDETEHAPGQWNDKKVVGNRRKDLISSLHVLGDHEDMLTPPSSVISVANQAAAKAMMFISGLKCWEWILRLH